MKKFIFVLVVLAVVSPIFAQNTYDSTENNNMYYINVLVERIYPSGRGYVVQYIKNSGELATIGIPNEWFMDIESAQSTEGTAAAASLHHIAAGRAEIMRLPPGRNWPSMSVFYVEGKFNHLRLYVHRVKSHQTWGNIPQGMDVSRFFSEDGESFNLQY